MAFGAALLLGCMMGARASVRLEGNEPSHDALTVWRPEPAKDRAQAERLIDGAARDLEQAALQSDLAGNARPLDLLRSAQDKLVRAMGPLSTDRWLQVDRLLENIDRVIARGSAQPGPLASMRGVKRPSGDLAHRAACSLRRASLCSRRCLIAWPLRAKNLSRD
jgi:hypothetical protein